MKKTILLISLMFLSGVGQAAPTASAVKSLHDIEQDNAISRLQEYVVDMCVHDWQPSKYYLGGPSFTDHTGGRSTYYSGNKPVEVCSKCGLIRIKPERK